jgi:hypothetical protein
MKPVTTFFAAVVVLTIGACSVFKKGTQKNPSASRVPSTPRIAPSVTSEDGVFAPGNAELMALQVIHKEVTMPTLVEGHKLYTGVCTQCHTPKSIYERPEKDWPGILSAMKKEANISDAQADAIYKYVLAIKATQPK